MSEFFYSPEARHDLLEIWEFIAQDDLDAADRVEREIEQAVTMLARNPELGHVRGDLTSKHVRFWPIYSYLIIYDPKARPVGSGPNPERLPRRGGAVEVTARFSTVHRTITVASPEARMGTEMTLSASGSGPWGSSTKLHATASRAGRCRRRT